MRSRHRIDGNQRALLEALKWSGCYFWDATQTNMGVDGLVVGHGRIVPVEFKMPRKDHCYQLTPREAEIHGILKAHGVTVEILTDEKSLEVLRPRSRNMYDAR